MDLSDDGKRLKRSSRASVPRGQLGLALFAIVFVLMSRINTSNLAAQDLTDSKRPNRLTAAVGDLLIRIDGPKLWTLSGIDYQNAVIAVQDSAYGCVLNIRGVGFLGTGHFLDLPDQPGKIEKEIVTRLQFFLDDRPVTEITPTMNLTGHSFRMERESTIRAVALNSSVIVRDGILVESVRLRTEKPVDLAVVYPLMYAWTPSATDYLFGDDGGVQKRGSFLDNSSKPTDGLEKTSRWMAVYDPSSGKGAVCYVLKKPPTADAWLQCTDAPGIYRKLRLMSFSNKMIPAGFDGTFQTAVGFFTATKNDFESEARRQMNTLKLLATTSEQP